MYEKSRLFIKSLGLVSMILGFTSVYPSKHKSHHRKTETEDESRADSYLTERIRGEIVRQGDLSQAAKNVVIVTKDKMVTLSGLVVSEAEKERIGQISARIAGRDKVHNELKIADENGD